MKRESALVCLVAMLVTATWTLVVGKDVSWDVVNHHLYLPFSLMTGRYLQDLSGAGPQSFQNPLGYLPAYLLMRVGLPGWTVGISLALLQAALIAWPLHRICLSLWPAAVSERSWRVLAMGLAWVSPAFLLVVGTTSNDPLCTGLTLLGLAGAISASAAPGLMLVGGLALGMAIGIKLTSGVFAIAIGCVLVVRLLTRQVTVKQVLAYTLSAGLGLLLVSGLWSVWLWRSYGNPVFPLFNQWFHSPFAPSGLTVSLRFLPQHPVDLLTRLWEMAEFRRYTVSETFVPDLRPVAWAGLTAAFLLAAPFRRRALLSGATLPARADVQLTIFLVVSYLIWMLSSGNARYALPWFLLVGVLAARAVQCLLPARVAPVVAMTLLVLQFLPYALEGEHRTMGTPWDSRRYIEAEVPARLRNEPFLHLSLGVQSFAVMALFLEERGSLINVSGQMSLPMEGPMGRALKARLAAWQGRTRFMLLAPANLDKPDGVRTVADNFRYLTYRYGLEIDWSDCEKLFLDVAPMQPPQQAVDRKTQDPHALGTHLLSCGSKPNGLHDEALARRMAQADMIFNWLESACPRVFGPTPLASEIGRTVIQRLYANSDARVNISPSEGVNLTHFRSLGAVHLGSIEQIMVSKGRDACTAWQMLPRQ